MTREEAIIYFEQCNSNIISVCKDENIYDYEKQDIISDYTRKTYEANKLAIEALEQEPKPRHCKDCKYFEYDSVAKVDGVPLIVAHEICNKWGNGCKSREDGYCFLFEEKESEDKV